MYLKNILLRLQFFSWTTFYGWILNNFSSYGYVKKFMQACVIKMCPQWLPWNFGEKTNTKQHFELKIFLSVTSEKACITLDSNSLLLRKSSLKNQYFRPHSQRIKSLIQSRSIYTRWQQVSSFLYFIALQTCFHSPLDMHSLFRNFQL